MADQAVVQPVGLIRNVRIHIHGISYFITLIVIRNKEINEAYSMLLGHPWLIDAKVTYDWGNKVILEECSVLRNAFSCSGGTFQT
jgi:hypothetical protein